MCRTVKEIDWQKVNDLLAAGSLGVEIAAYFDMHPKTFYDKVVQKFNITFTEYCAQKKPRGDCLLRAHQYAKALGFTKKGDTTLLIWLGKQRLGQRDNKELSNHELSNLSTLKDAIDSGDLCQT